MKTILACVSALVCAAAPLPSCAAWLLNQVSSRVVNGEPADVDGETLSAHAGLTVPADPVPVLVAALGPQMLKLAAERTAGTITWMTGPKTLGEHTVPTINGAADAAGVPTPRVVGALPVAVTDDPDSARAKAAKVFQVYGFLPSYRAMLDREGVEGPGDVCIVGSAAEVEAGIGRMRDAGFPVEWGPGRHGAGDNVFCYFAGPEEFPIEYTGEVLQVDDSYQFHGPEYWKWPPGRLDQWGITPPHTARWKRIQDMYLFAPEQWRIL